MLVPSTIPIGLLLLTCGAAANAPAEIGRVTKSQFAREVEQTLKSLRKLSFEAVITAFPYRMHVVTQMTPDALRTEVFEHGELTASFSFSDGFIEEYRREWRVNGWVVPDATLRYPARTPTGTDNTFLSAPSDCLIGSYLSSWLGENGYKGSLFRQRIEEGEARPDVEIRGRRCRVFAWETGVADYLRRDIFYFDTKTKLLLKWETFEADAIWLSPRNVWSGNLRRALTMRCREYKNVTCE